MFRQVPTPNSLKIYQHSITIVEVLTSEPSLKFLLKIKRLMKQYILES